MSKTQKKSQKKGARDPPVDHDGMAVESSDGGFSGPEGPPSSDGQGEPAAKKANTTGIECFDIATPGASSTPSGTVSPPSSAPAAAPVEAAPPGISEVLLLLHTMNQNLSNQGQQLARFNDRFEAQDRLMANIDRTIVSAVDNIDSRLEKFKLEVDARFAKLAISPQPAAVPREAPWTKSSGGASSGGPPAHSPARSAAAGSPAASSSAAAEFGRKVIAIGFPRTLPKPALQGWWEDARLQLPLDIQSKGTFQGGTGKAFSVVFPSRADARSFTSAISSGKVNFLWTSPRKDEKPYPINFKTERTVEEKDRGRALSGAWQLLSPLIHDSANFDPDKMKFTTDPRRGAISVATGLDMWDLVQLKSTAGTYSITTNDESFSFFGIPPEVADAVRTSLAAPRAAP
jgi:hypothetical protein